MTDSRAYTYTTDPNRVISVVWSIASEFVADYDQETDSPIDGPHDSARMRAALDYLFQATHAEYPKTTDILIFDGGFENQFSPMAPRCETDDESIYEPFYDDMTRLEDAAIAHAFTLYPQEPMKCRYCGDDAPSGVCDACDRKWKNPAPRVYAVAYLDIAEPAHIVATSPDQAATIYRDQATPYERQGDETNPNTQYYRDEWGAIITVREIQNQDPA